MALHDLADLRRTCIEGKARPGEERDADVTLGEFAAREGDFTLTGLWKEGYPEKVVVDA